MFHSLWATAIAYLVSLPFSLCTSRCLEGWTTGRHGGLHGLDGCVWSILSFPSICWRRWRLSPSSSSPPLFPSPFRLVNIQIANSDVTRLLHFFTSSKRLFLHASSTSDVHHLSSGSYPINKDAALLPWCHSSYSTNPVRLFQNPHHSKYRWWNIWILILFLLQNNPSAILFPLDHYIFHCN